MITRYLVLNNKDMNEEDLIQAVSMSGDNRIPRRSGITKPKN